MGGSAVSATKNQRVLVVGGAGFLGQSIVSALAATGYDVVVLDVFKMSLGPSDVEYVIGSALDEALLASAANGCNIVIFLAASSLPESANADIASEISAHVRMVIKAAEISCNQGVSKFLFSSSGGTVYGMSPTPLLSEQSPTRPLNAYGVSKLAIELYLNVLSQNRPMRSTSLRIGNPYGIGQRAARKQGFVAAAMAAAISGKTLQCWGDGSNVRDFIYVSDVADAFVHACGILALPSEINIGSGRGKSLLEVIKAVEEITGKQICVNFHPGRSIDVKVNVLDIALAKDVLGWAPKVMFEDGIRKTLAWWTSAEGV